MSDTRAFDKQIADWALNHATHEIVKLRFDALAKEHALCWPVAKFCTGVNPPEPGLYLARVEVSHAGKVLFTRRSFEEWTGDRWACLVEDVYRVTGWISVES